MESKRVNFMNFKMKYVLCLYLVAFLTVTGCAEKPNDAEADISSLALLFGSVAVANNSFFPAEMESVSPSHKDRFRSAYTEAGEHYNSNQCQSGGILRLEKVVPLDKITVTAVFKEDISEGTLVIKKGGVPINGTVTRPNARTIRFVSDSPGDLYQKYHASTTGVKLALDEKKISDSSWFFHYDLNGDRGDNPNKITIRCSEISGTNVCNFEAKYHLGRLDQGEVSPQVVFNEAVPYFRTDVGVQGNELGAVTLWSYEVCETGSAGIPAKPAGTFLFAKMTGQVPWEIPRNVVEANPFYVGAMTQTFRNVFNQSYSHAIYPEELPTIQAIQQ
ncbi:hypothetical protein JWG45_15635 [Leptospira sp. 201903070]|uniref:Lipoprotein n=1 Tax=Leptospira ainlahdjerensis TaxID=2810033 RepID=A0ABS2UDY3_9LEPT|nr:hypothetical protein [Leptospira ainlahdjerensis]MBM9578579.1 hypothetical protein [Leptospira ainlahdjerensis]